MGNRKSSTSDLGTERQIALDALQIHLEELAKTDQNLAYLIGQAVEKLDKYMIAQIRRIYFCTSDKQKSDDGFVFRVISDLCEEVLLELE